MPEDLFAGLNGVDIALLGALLVSALLGLMRGLAFEVMSLAGWVVAYVAAYLYAPQLPPLWSAQALPADPVTGAAAMPLVAFILVFAGVLIVWTLLSHLVRMLVRATPLSGLDRLLGGAFGCARGLLMLIAVAVIVALTPWSRSAAWQKSVVVPRLERAIVAIKPLLPPGIGRWMAR